MSFDAFQTGITDEVTIYDGPSTSSPVLLKASGSDMPPVVHSTGDVVFATFITGSSGVTTGFSAKFMSERGE